MDFVWIKKIYFTVGKKLLGEKQKTKKKNNFEIISGNKNLNCGKICFKMKKIKNFNCEKLFFTVKKIKKF